VVGEAKLILFLIMVFKMFRFFFFLFLDEGKVKSLEDGLNVSYTK